MDFVVCAVLLVLWLKKSVSFFVCPNLSISVCCLYVILVRIRSGLSDSEFPAKHDQICHSVAK